jgi:hypothetical protein
MRLTGEGHTCLSNSLCTMAAQYAIIGDNPHSDVNLYVARYNYLGLKAKLSKSMEFPTFLKGVLLRDPGGELVWTRLPSFVLKFGKVLTSIDTIVKHKVTYDEKCKRMLLAQWLGYGNMQTNWFYINIDLEIKRICQECYTRKTYVMEPHEPWKIKQSPTYVDSDEFDRFMLSRYNIDSTEMDDFLNLLGEITDLPVVYTHPISRKLIADY